jgi:hypothetical protein
MPEFKAELQCESAETMCGHLHMSLECRRWLSDWDEKFECGYG